MGTMLGAEILINCLLEQGVDTVFGYPGGAILHVYDQLYAYSDQIRHVLTGHEQGAAHAADGYARSTGKVGVCMATSGPGATNLVTGIATAYMDSVPMVCITANVKSNLIGTDAFQEVDIVGITLPITKHSAIVREVKNLAETVREAFAIAQSGRPGPVLIDLPKDVLMAAAEYEKQPAAPLEHQAKVAQGDLQAAAKCINKAVRPVILTGGGAGLAGVSAEVRTLAKTLRCPVVSTLMGLGVVDGRDEQFFGMIGMHGKKAANRAVVQSDVLIAIGSRFNDRVAANKNALGKGKKVIHLDADQAEIDKNVLTHLALVGDTKDALCRLLPMVTPRQDDGFLKQMQEQKAPDKVSFPKQIMETIHQVQPDGLVVADVGQHQMWAAQYLPFHRYRQWMTSGGLGTMGYSLGAAIGAKLGNPDKAVTQIVGDGCFGMNCNELSTLSRYQVPVVIVLINNGVLGMVRQWQTLFYDRHYSHTTLTGMPDYQLLAKSYGLDYAEAKEKKSFEKAYKEALKQNKATIINCVIDPDLFVAPMASGEKEIDQFILA